MTLIAPWNPSHASFEITKLCGRPSNVASQGGFAADSGQVKRGGLPGTKTSSAATTQKARPNVTKQWCAWVGTSQTWLHQPKAVPVRPCHWPRTLLHQTLNPCLSCIAPLTKHATKQSSVRKSPIILTKCNSLHNEVKKSRRKCQPTHNHVAFLVGATRNRVHVSLHACSSGVYAAAQGREGSSRR
jgi:hypothetical protein